MLQKHFFFRTIHLLFFILLLAGSGCASGERGALDGSGQKPEGDGLENEERQTVKTDFLRIFSADDYPILVRHNGEVWRLAKDGSMFEQMTQTNGTVKVFRFIHNTNTLYYTAVTTTSEVMRVDVLYRLALDNGSLDVVIPPLTSIQFERYIKEWQNWYDEVVVGHPGIEDLFPPIDDYTAIGDFVVSDDESVIFYRHKSTIFGKDLIQKNEPFEVPISKFGFCGFSQPMDMSDNKEFLLVRQRCYEGSHEAILSIKTGKEIYIGPGSYIETQGHILGKISGTRTFIINTFDLPSDSGISKSAFVTSTITFFDAEKATTTEKKYIFGEISDITYFRPNRTLYIEQKDYIVEYTITENLDFMVKRKIPFPIITYEDLTKREKEFLTMGESYFLLGEQNLSDPSKTISYLIYSPSKNKVIQRFVFDQKT